jgi:Rrf2 family protein
MKLSTRMRYGTRAMISLALHHDQGPLPLEVLAREQQIPHRYLAKIIQDLRRGGLVRSVRGAHGGYELCHHPSDTNLLDVWEALEGPFCPVDCLEHPDGCNLLNDCVTRDVWGDVRDALTAVLQSVSLGDLANRRRKAKD